MKSIPGYFRLLLLLMLLNIGNVLCAQEASISRGSAGEKIECFYSDLGAYAKRAREYSGQFSNYEKIKERVLDAVTKDCLITNDLLRFDGQKKLEEIKIGSYLTNLNVIASDGNRISFEVDCRNMTFDFNRDNNTYLAGGVILRVTASRYSYQCKATIGFKGDKIDRIKYSEFENVVNPPDSEHNKSEDPTKPILLFPTHVIFSAGWKITNGVNLGVGIDGISKNWFINHLRFGVEYNMLFNQEGYAHYPTSTDGTSATMTYRTRENDDYGLGIDIGYRIIPGKYDNVSILGGPGRFFLSMGGGIIRYGRWWEYQGTADPIEHPRNTAFYIKPAVTLEYLLSDFWGIGLETSYYYSPQYSQINGVGLNAMINYAF